MSNEQIDQIRADFEQFAVGTERNESGRYVDIDTHIQWTAWQAARARYAGGGESAEDQLISERDYWEEIAGLLADKVGALLGVDVGEHTSENCPVKSAIESVDDAIREAEQKPADSLALPEIYEQYQTWPEDIRRKLSLNDLRRMTGWKLHCCTPAQPKVPELLPMEPFQTINAGSKDYKAGWNACREAMLASQEGAPTASAVPDGFLKWLDAVVTTSNLAGIGDHETAWTWPAPRGDIDFFAGYPQLTTGILRELHAMLTASKEGR